MLADITARPWLESPLWFLAIVSLRTESCLWTTVYSTHCFYHGCLPDTCTHFSESAYASSFYCILRQWLLLFNYASIILCLLIYCVKMQVPLFLLNLSSTYCLGPRSCIVWKNMFLVLHGVTLDLRPQSYSCSIVFSSTAKLVGGLAQGYLGGSVTLELPCGSYS